MEQPQNPAPDAVAEVESSLEPSTNQHHREKGLPPCWGLAGFITTSKSSDMFRGNWKSSFKVFIILPLSRECHYTRFNAKPSQANRTILQHIAMFML